MNNRRDFLRLSGRLAAVLAVAPMACKLSSNNEKENKTDSTGTKSGAAPGASGETHPFGIQLYTLRDDFPKDPKGTLAQLAKFGYTEIESFEGKEGMFWGLGAAGFKQYLDTLNMTAVSSHCDISKDFERKAADAASIGMKYLICPYKGEQKSLDDYKKFADEFNQKGEICRKNGLRFAYHNHDYSFKKLDGQYPQDVMMANTDPALVDYEMDIYWVVTAGEDPNAWLKKYSNRFKLCHVKDRTKGATEAADTCTLGQGTIDFAPILKTAKENGMAHYIVEQEKYTGTTPIKSSEDNAGYMKALKF